MSVYKTSQIVIEVDFAIPDSDLTPPSFVAKGTMVNGAPRATFPTIEGVLITT